MHVFDIIAGMIRDDSFKVENIQAPNEFKQAVDEHTERIHMHY